MCSVHVWVLNLYTKLQISKSTPKGDILFFKNFQELQRMARLDYTVFSSICDIITARLVKTMPKLQANQCAASER